MPSSSLWTHRIGALAVGLGLAMSAVIVPCWWSIARYQSPSCSASKPDFISLYTGAKLFWTNRSALYNLEQQRMIQERVDPSRGGHRTAPAQTATKSTTNQLVGANDVLQLRRSLWFVRRPDIFHCIAPAH